MSAASMALEDQTNDISESHLTRLQGVSEEGALILITEDRSVQNKVLALGDGLKSFAYWTGAEEEIVTGRVISIIASDPFQFKVMAEEAGEGP